MPNAGGKRCTTFGNKTGLRCVCHWKRGPGCRHLSFVACRCLVQWGKQQTSWSSSDHLQISYLDLLYLYLWIPFCRDMPWTLWVLSEGQFMAQVPRAGKLDVRRGLHDGHLSDSPGAVKNSFSTKVYLWSYICGSMWRLCELPFRCTEPWPLAVSPAMSISAHPIPSSRAKASVLGMLCYDLLKQRRHLHASADTMKRCAGSKSYTIPHICVASRHLWPFWCPLLCATSVQGARKHETPDPTPCWLTLIGRHVLSFLCASETPLSGCVNCFTNGHDSIRRKCGVCCEEEAVKCPEGKYTQHANYATLACKQPWHAMTVNGVLSLFHITCKPIVSWIGMFYVRPLKSDFSTESTGKAGFNVETCCVPNFCPPKLCEILRTWFGVHINSCNKM